MGNEASLEGGEGLPEGLAPDGKGGFVRVSDGTPVDLSKLSEEQRQQLSAAMARAQGKQPPGAAARRPSQGDVQQRSQQVGGSRGSGGLSKSRTVDAFNQGPVGKPSPGRSPSSLSLFESRFRQEPKTSESKSSGMFGSSFLSGANPLSAMTSSLSSMGDSVNIPKFGIFGDEEEGDSPAKGPQQQGPKGPQQGGLQKPGQGPAGQGPKPGQGPPGQGPKPGQGPSGQGPKPGQGPPGQGPKPGQGPPGQGPKPGHGPPGQGAPGQGPKPGQGPQGQGPKPGQGPQGQGPKPGQGPQGQGPKPGQGPQGQGPKPAQGPQGQGPKQGQGPPGPGAKPTGPPQQGAGPKQQAPVGTGSQPSKNAGPATQQGAGKAVPCPLCKTTQMNIGSKDPPNYNNCTECKSQVCSLCGFSPPDSAGKEWLCLNCQMQRAMGGMDPPNPKHGSVPPSPQRQAPGKPGNLLIKQQSHQSDQGLTPPTTPRQKSPGPTSSGPPSPGSSMAGSPKIDPKTGKPIMQKSSPQQSPSKAKQESSFFGGFGLGGLTDSVKSSSTSSQSESVTGKLFGGFGGLMETSKPPAQTASKQEESVAGKLFSGFGGLSDSSSKPPAAASQMFSFGSSLLSSATNLVTGDDSTPAEPSGSPPQSPDSGPGSPPDSPFSAPGSPPDTDSAPDTPPARFTKPTKSMSIDAEKKPALAAPAQSCPLCNVELNMGSSDTPNYSLCTECKKTVCNLCGFNPMPHLGEREWLCLNCQTQRAMAGQLGDEPPPVMGSPKKQQPPAPVAPTSTSTSTTPAPAPAPASVEIKPVVEPSTLNPDVKVEDPNIPLQDNSSATSPPDDTPHQTKEYITGNTPELPALVQTQSSLDREEGGPKPETNTEPCVPVTVVAPHQEDKNTLIQPPSEESETLNLSTKTEIDNTTALLETQPNPEISQSEAPADKQEDASPTADTLLEEPTNSCETKTVTDPVVIQENCETGADVLLKEQGEPNVEDAQSKPVDQSLTETIGDNVIETESVQAEITEKERDAITGITNEVEQCVENKEVISTTEQLHTESTTEETIPEVKPVEENSVEVTPADNSTTEGEVVQQEIITVKDRAIESPEIINEVEQCIESKEIVSSTEQLPIKGPTEEIITEVKPVEENIMGVTTANNSTAEAAMIKVKDSAIESPEVVDTSQTYDAKAQEEEVAERSTEVKADEGEENRQEDLGQSVGEEESTNISLIPSAEDSNKSVAQASTHFEEHVGTSEKTGSSNLIEQNDTNAQEPLPSEDNIQVSAVASEDVKCEIALEQPSQSIANVPTESQQEDNYDVSALTRANEKPVEEVAEQKVSVTEKEKQFCTNVVESQPVTENLVSEPDSAGVVKDATPECQIELSIPSHNENTQSVFQLDSTPLEKTDIPESVVCSSLDQSDQVENTEEPLVKPIKEDAEVKTTEPAPTEKEPETTGSPTGLSDLTKLENTVLPILEAQPKPEEHTLVDTPKTRRKLEVLPIMPDSPSSEEEREALEQNVKEKKKLLVPMDIRGDSLEDSSESIGKESPMSGDDEDFIRKQIIEMSENEDASPTDEENVIRQKIKKQENNTASVEKSASGRARRLTKKATISPDEDEDKHVEDAAAEVVQEGKESKPENSGQAVRQFQTMELNAPGMKIASSEGEVEMECLTDSPDDRSKGEGSSSLHASSFTPGTSPTSMSSFDEDSDSSSPSNMSTGEGKQQRKAKHRQPGQLPTIEDSSEEEELREEEELLREQEKQKSSGKKSKRDKEDKSQRRRERSKTPPSNLSPIEDASPTEELRQEAEMEEIRRSSCSDFSPSLESDPEGFEIHASKIAAFQKSYKLPVSSDSLTEDKTQNKPLKTADETYEEIMLRAKSPTTEKVDNHPEKEALYGGMLIEDYAYTSLIDNSTIEKEEPERMALPTQPKKLRSPDEVYEDMLKKRKEFQKLEEEYQKMQPKQEPVPTPEIVLQPAENINIPTTITIDTDGKPLLDADTAYEELMRKVLTPTSPSQQDQDVETTPTKRALYPIPDLKVTQCSSGELSSDEEFYKKEEEPETPEPPPVSESSQVSPSEPSDIIVTTSQAAVDLSGLSKATPLMCSVTPLPTVPQYTPGIQSVVTTAPPVPPKPYIMRRGHSQDSADMAVAPPPTTAKPTVFPRKAPVPLPHQASATTVKPEDPISMTAFHGSPIRQPTGIPTYRAHVPPPVPPKPCIPCGMAAHGVKPPIAPKPASQPTSPAHVPHPPRPTMLPTGSAEIALNLSPTSEHKQFQSSPKSPPSPRYASNLRDTYVVITLPSQPSSPVEPIMTQAPSSPAPASPLHQAPPHCYTQPQAQQPTFPPQQVPPQSQRVPLAYTRVTESIENQEICSPEKHVSSSCRIIEAISASAQPPVVTPNLISQVVTTEVQRTTVSVVHERTPPPVPAPRANGVPLDKTKQQNPLQTTQAVQPCEVVDLRTMKVDQQSTMNGVDLSAGPDPRRQTYVTDASRQNSAVQSPVVNLSAESSTVSIVTDSITIVTCAATIQRWDNVDGTATSSVPLQLTKNKSFEPLSQIVFRPVDGQPPVQAGAEIPINLSVGSGAGTYQSAPVTTAPPCAFSANGLTTGTAMVAGAVDLSTTKPFNTLVSMDGASSEAVTAVITDDDGKPVDLTGGKRAVCCDVVYNLPFAGSCTRQQPTTPLPEDRFGYRDDHYQYDRTPYGMKGFGGIKPSMSDTNLAEAGLFFYKSKNSYNFNGTTDGAVDLTSAKISDAGEAVDYSKKGMYAGMAIPPFSDARVTSAVGTVLGTTNVLRSSNGIVYSSVGSPNPSTYAITTQPGSIFSTTYNNQSGMHTSDTMPSLSNLQNIPLTRSHSFISTLSTTEAEAPLNLELCRTGTTGIDSITPASLTLDTYTDASLEAIAASLEALSSPMVAGDGQYLAERERLEMEKLKQHCLAEELEKERQEIQRFREHEQVLVQKELEELQSMKQQILDQQEEERQAHLLMQKETYAQQQQQLEQIQRLQEQLRLQLEEQKLRQLYPGVQEAVVLGPDGTVLARKITDSGCQTDEEDETISNAYTAGRKKKNAKKSVDSCVQTDDEDQEDWEENRNRRPRTARGDRIAQSEVSLQAHTEISIQTDTEGNIRMESRLELSDSDSPKKRLTPLQIGQSGSLKSDSLTLQAPKSPKVLYSPLSPGVSPGVSPSKSVEFVSYEKSLGGTSPQKLSPRGKAMQRSLSDPKPTAEERATSGPQYGPQSKPSTPTGTQKKVKRTLPNPPSEEESTTATATTTTGQTAYSTNSARRRMCRNSNMARAKILQDIDRELDMVERESSKLRHRQAELDEEEKEIDAKLRYLEMGINRRKDALLKERDKRERAYLQSVADDRDYMSDSEVSHIRETRSVIGAVEDEDIELHGLERPRTAPQSELDDFDGSETKGEYEKYSQYPYSQSQYQSLYQTPQSYQSPSIYSSVPSLTSSQQQSYHQMLLLQQKAARQAALLSELDATKYDVISRQPDPTSSAYLGVKYDKYGNHLDLRALDVGSIANTPMSAVSDSYYSDVDHHTPRSYMLLEDAAEIAKGSTGLSSSYSLAERELAKAEKLLRRSAADLGSTDYLGSTSRLHTYGKTPDDEDTMEEPYELKLLKQQLKQEFRRSTGGTESLEQLSGQHYYTPTTGLSSYSQRQYPKTDKYSISRLTLEKQAAKQLPAPMLYQKHKTPLIEPKVSSKYSSVGDRGLESEYTSYIGSSGSPRTSRLMQDEITFGLRKNIAEQQKYLGSNLGANLAGSLNLGQSLGLDSAYPSGSRSRPPSRPTSCYGLDLSIKRDPSSSSLRLKGDGESGDGSSYQTPSGRTKPTSLPIVQSGRGRLPIVAQNSEEESPLSPVGQPMGMARASAGPLPPISADSRDQFGSCLSLQDTQQQQQYIREEPTRGRGSVLLDDLQGTMSDSEALSEHPMTASSGDATHAYHLRHEETDWYEKPRDGRADGLNKRQGKGPYYPFPHLRVKLQRDPKDRTVSGNGLGIRIVGGKEVPNSNGDIGAYVAKVLPGGAAEQTGKILEGMQVLEWNGMFLTGKTYEEVQGLVGQPCNEAEMCVRLDLNMLAESEMSQNLDFQEHSKSERPPRSPGVDPMQLAAELQKVSQQQAPLLPTSSTSSPAQPGSPSIGKKRHSSKSAEGTKTHLHPISGEIQLQIHYDKQLGNLIVHVLQARNLAPRDNNGYSDPFVKVYLLPGRGAENKRKSKHAGRSINPEWNQTVIYKNIHLEQLKKKTLEVSVWDYDKCSSNDFLGEVLIDLSNTSQLDNAPRWVPLKEQSEGDHHRRSHSGQSRHSSKTSSQHSSPKTGSTHDIHDSPKSSVTKSRSHGVFPDPAKDTQVPSIEKSHSSPGTAKPSQSEGHGQGQHSRSHAAHTKSTTRHHQDSGRGSTIAAGDALVQSQQQPPQRLQPSHRGRFSLKPQRHSVVGVLTIQRGQSDWLPTQPPAALRRPPDGRLVTLRKAWSEERPQSSGARSAYRSGETPVTAASMDSGLSGSVYSLLDEEAEANEVDSAIFQVPRFGKIPNGTDIVKSSMGHHEGEGKTHAMGEIKIALKKEVRTEGDHLVLEILQCRNITYKFKSPDHLPDLYVKLYVVNIATQKRIIKKKTRVCRHDREPSFNETFRFCMNPTGHALQLFLVSNGGKFVKKTLIGEAYVWLDKVDLRKRVVSWHKLHTSTAQIHS